MESSKDYDNIFGALDDDKKAAIVEADKKMTELFRRVFSGQEGKTVLWQLLTDLKFFSECVTETDVALNNFAKFMIFKRLKIDNTRKITNLLVDMGE